MSSSPDTFMQGRLNMNDIESRSRGQWRIFSKVGWGNGDQNAPENTLNGYSCFPQVDQQGQIVANSGFEFVISARISTVGGTFKSVDSQMRDVTSSIIDAITNGHLT
jgi:hypothetical protein